MCRCQEGGGYQRADAEQAGREAERAEGAPGTSRVSIPLADHAIGHPPGPEAGEGQGGEGGQPYGWVDDQSRRRGDQPDDPAEHEGAVREPAGCAGGRLQQEGTVSGVQPVISGREGHGGRRVRYRSRSG